MAVADRASGLAALRSLDERYRPVTMAGRQLLPVLGPLEPLVPGGGLRRGSTIEVGGLAATSLALSLVAEASGQGSWVAVVGLPTLGLVAAAELGVALDRMALVPHTAPGTWATVVAALVDAVDIVVLGPAKVRQSDARRIAARARERGAVVVPVGFTWPQAADVALTVTTAQWDGIASGSGHLGARRIEIEASGRREAALSRRVVLDLPSAAGGVEAPAPSPTPIRAVP